MADEPGVSLSEIPPLLDMQLHCATAGFICTAGWWWLAVSSSIPEQTIRNVLGVLLGCFFLVLPLRAASQHFQKKNDVTVSRMWLMMCSVSSVLGMGVLLWASGGLESPFLALYAMTHAITLTKTRAPGGVWWTLVLFAVPLLGIYLLRENAAATFGPYMPAMEATPQYQIVVGLAAVSPIFISTTSTWFTELHANLRLRRRVESSRVLLDDFLRSHHIGCNVEVLGKTYVCGTDRPTNCTLSFPDPRSLLRLTNGLRLITFAKMYLDGALVVIGTADSITELADKLHAEPTKREVIAGRVLRRGRRRKLRHYDHPPEVYRLFLDVNMQYTCGLFEDPKLSLEDAQIAKFEFIRKQLELKMDTRHLDIGCGWGGLISYFAQNYGTASVGVTNSDIQGQYGQQLLGRQLATASRIEIGDYSKVMQRDTYDAITIVGMLEHIPIRHQAAFWELVNQSLRRGGKVYLQCITRSPEYIGGDGTRFLQDEVFSFELDTVEEHQKRIQAAKLKVMQTFNHSTHYDQTASAWVKNLEANREAIVNICGERDFRVLFGYLALATRVFRDGRGALHRLILQKP